MTCRPWLLFIMLGLILLVLSGCAIFEPGPPMTAAEQVSWDLKMYKQCVFIHGAESVICR